MRLIPFALAGLLLLACRVADTHDSDPAAPAERDFGPIQAVYPFSLKSGGWMLEYRFTRDTAFVDLALAQTLVRDSLWKEALTTVKYDFYDDGDRCLYPRLSEAKGCLPYQTREEVIQSDENSSGAPPPD